MVFGQKTWCFDFFKGAKCYINLQVRIGDNLAPAGGIEASSSGSAMVFKRYAALEEGGVKAQDLRAKPQWFHDILTPYDNHALGQARPLDGNIVSVGSSN